MLGKSWQIYVAAGFSLRRKCSIIGRAVHADGDHAPAYMTVILMQRSQTQLENEMKYAHAG